MDDEIARRRALTFEEAEGVVPLPTQYAIGELPQSAKAKLWDALHDVIKAHEPSSSYYIHSPLVEIAKMHFVEIEHGYADEFDSHVSVVVKRWKAYFAPNAPYFRALGLVQFILRQRPFRRLVEATHDALKKSAYRLVNNDTIVPVASETEAKTFENAVSMLGAQKLTGARGHILEAAGQLSEGKFADSVRESIHAVESALRVRTGERKFAAALSKLNEEKPMHEAFKRGLGNFYGYSSDEEGIRHPLLEQGDSKVSQADALLMLGICASFITYLLGE